MRSTIAVLAKAPVPGRVKTRLCPPFEPLDAARLAAAALRDTLEAVAATPCDRRFLVLDGIPGSWVPRGFEVIPQCSGELGSRLADAFRAAGGPALVLGMDTPQVTDSNLTDALTALDRDDADAVLGLALDGGYWSIGLMRPDARVFAGVPMSTSHTGARQLANLRALEHRVQLLPTMRDVDTVDDAAAVAALAPATCFAEVFRRIRSTVAVAP